MSLRHKNFIRRRFGLTQGESPAVPLPNRELEVLRSIAQEQQELIDIYLRQIEGFKILIDVKDQEIARHQEINRELVESIAEHMTWKWPVKRLWQLFKGLFT